MDTIIISVHKIWRHVVQISKQAILHQETIAIRKRGLYHVFDLLSRRKEHHDRERLPLKVVGYNNVTQLLSLYSSCIPSIH